MSVDRSDLGGGSKHDRVVSVLVGRMRNGEYPLNSLLPLSEEQLAQDQDVSRDTVRRALKTLKDDGWIESRQGSGWRVLKVEPEIPSSEAKGGQKSGLTLPQLMKRAFAKPVVVLDVSSLTSESLADQMSIISDDIRGGALSAPERITLRLMLPSDELDMAYPRAVDPQDYEVVRERQRLLTKRSVGRIREKLHSLKAHGYVGSVDILTCRVPLTPTSKLYLLNGTEAVHGPYLLKTRSVYLEETESEVVALDAVGIAGPMEHFVVDDGNPQASAFVRNQQGWFNSLWEQYAT
ncbi:GntR family transcriptional regulator [Streptomyces sp. SID12501]|uniref:GntR family transcriptional regulator n=1 Tax=Streptomyces sp. SID12501 TaxID=2706042 RepID=A0A6B3C3L5_9ACTN|nr:GntR family transcriptional regulator [Streptomyces sp. SID12501]